MSESTTTPPDVAAPDGADPARPWYWALLGVAVVVLLAAVTRFLESAVPAAAEGTGFAGVAKAVEYPVYAILLGLAANAVLSALGIRRRLAGGFRTEFFIKTGLVLLGSTVLFDVIIKAAGPAILQAILLVSAVFLFTWWLGGRFGLDDRLRALLASSVSICGVSAAIAAAGAVQARKEQLAYTASLVILFALPSIFLLPWLVEIIGLNAAQAGAWIGGNIDTTAAVAASGAIVGEGALQIALSSSPRRTSSWAWPPSCSPPTSPSGWLRQAGRRSASAPGTHSLGPIPQVRAGLPRRVHHRHPVGQCHGRSGSGRARHGQSPA